MKAGKRVWHIQAKEYGRVAYIIGRFNGEPKVRVRWNNPIFENLQNGPFRRTYSSPRVLETVKTNKEKLNESYVI